MLLDIRTSCASAALAAGKRVFFADLAHGKVSSVFEASDRIRCVSAARGSNDDASSTRLAILTDDKKLATLDTDADLALRAVDSVVIPKRGTAIARFVLPSAAGGAGAPVLCVGDKWGDVITFPDPRVSSKSRVLLGHTACVITALESSLDGRFIFSADREERIRVSGFPLALNIKSFCMGHTRFVSLLKVLSKPVGASYAAGQVLLSGGADGTLRLWHWASGTLLHTLRLLPGEVIDYGKPYEMNFRHAEEVAPLHPGPLAAATYRAQPSEGAHEDGAMNEVAGEDEGGAEEGGAEEATAAPASAVSSSAPGATEAASCVSVAGSSDDEQTPAAAAAAADASASAGAGAATSAAGAEPKIPKAYLGSVRHRRNLQPVFPVSVTECAHSGLLATFVEGEHAIRFVRVGMEATPARISVALGQTAGVRAAPLPGFDATNDTLPQARLSQVGVFTLPRRPLCVTFDPRPAADGASAVLLVGTTTPRVGGELPASAHEMRLAASMRYEVQAYSVTVSEAGEASVSRLFSHDMADLLNQTLASWEPMTAAEADALRGSVFADRLDEYDTCVKPVLDTRAASTAVAPAASASATAAVPAPAPAGGMDVAE